MSLPVPVVLFAYNRPNHLQRTLESLKQNRVPLIYAFCDGPKSSDDFEKVSEVHRILHEVDWCEIHITRRETNLGLGVSIRTGVSEVFQKHEMLIVFEDDLICVPGTYQYLCAALQRYKDSPNVMSVTGFNHPLNTPKDITDQPYFDGRADCLVWGSWARAWEGMHEPAQKLIERCLEKGIDPYRYGSSLPSMAKAELQRNIWAVRFLYLHILKGGLCLRPPYSMVEHIGADRDATNASTDPWPAPPLKELPPVPRTWPEPVEHPDCSRLWQEAEGLASKKFKTGNSSSEFLTKQAPEQGIGSILLKTISGPLRKLIINPFYQGVILKIMWQNFRNRYAGMKLETRNRQKEAEALIEKEEIIRGLLQEHKGSTFLEIGLGPSPNLERMRLISQNNILYTGCDFDETCQRHEKILAANHLSEAKIRLMPNRVGTYAWTLFDLMKMGEQFDLIYIDGSHTFYVDLPAFMIADHLLKPGGGILIDDIDFTMDSLRQDMASDFNTWKFYRLKYDFHQYESEQQRIPHIRKIVEDFFVPRLGYNVTKLSENPFIELRLLKKR